MSQQAEKAEIVFKEMLGELTAGLEKAKHDNNGQLIRTILPWIDKISPHLEELDNTKSFAKAWFLQATFTELLKYSIEDDRLDISEIRSAIDPIEKLLEDDDWLTPKLQNFFEQLQELPNKTEIKARKVELCVHARSGVVTCIPGWIPDSRQPAIPVSSEAFLFVPILEDGIADPKYAHGIINAYAERLEYIARRDKITHFGFIEKSVGPVGALGLLGALTSRLDEQSAFVYRAGHWPHRSKLSGISIPLPKNARVALVYDLIVTGGALKQAANDLYNRFEAEVTSAVVLFGYHKHQYEENGFELECDHGNVKVDAIGWYEDHLSDIQNVYENEMITPNEHLKILTPNERSDLSLVGNGKITSPLNKGGDMMNPKKADPRTMVGPYERLAKRNLRKALLYLVGSLSVATASILSIVLIDIQLNPVLSRYAELKRDILGISGFDFLMLVLCIIAIFLVVKSGSSLYRSVNHIRLLHKYSNKSLS